MTTDGHGAPPRHFATLSQIRACNWRAVALPGTSERMGKVVRATIRPIRPTQYQQMLPPPLPGDVTEGWRARLEAAPPERVEAERLALIRAYLSDHPEERAVRDATLERIPLQVVAAGVVGLQVGEGPLEELRLTPEEALDLGDDVEVLWVEILRFSGLLRPTEPAPAAEPAASRLPAGPDAVDQAAPAAKTPHIPAPGHG